MNNRLFDDGYFAPRAEGNLPFRPDSYLQTPVVMKRPDSWVTPYVTRNSIMTQPMKTVSCPAPTFDSYVAANGGMLTSFSPFFSSFAMLDDSEISSDPNDVTNPNYQAKTPTPTVVQPGAVKGNGILDAISGIIKGITPAAAAAITGTNTNQNQLMQLYLKGQLPNYTIDMRTGQLVPKTQASQNTSSLATPLIIAGIAGLALVMLARR